MAKIDLTKQELELQEEMNNLPDEEKVLYFNRLLKSNNIFFRVLGWKGYKWGSWDGPRPTPKNDPTFWKKF